MKKKFSYSRHLIFHFDNLDLISFGIITIVIVIFGTWKHGFHLNNIIVELALSLFIYLLFIIFRFLKIQRSIGNYNKISEELCRLFENINEKINNSSNNLQLTEDLNNLSEAIKLVISRNSQPLKFNPDDEAINKLYNVNNLIVITEAEPFKWLDPTYIFYLINNAFVNLNWRYGKKVSKMPISFATSRFDERDTEGENKFNDYLHSKKKIVEDLSKIEPNQIDSLNNFFNELNGTIRFMFLSDEDIKLYRSTIEYLYTVHEMSGCFLYLINIDLYKANFRLQNKNIIEHRSLNRVIESTDYDIIANGSLVDIGFGLSRENNFEVFQRSKQSLESKQLNDVVKIHLANYLKELATYILAGNNYDNERYLFDNYFKNINSLYLNPNTRNYFIYFKD